MVKYVWLFSFSLRCVAECVYIVMNEGAKRKKYKRENVGSFRVNKSKHILSIKLPSRTHVDNLPFRIRPSPRSESK